MTWSGKIGPWTFALAIVIVLIVVRIVWPDVADWAIRWIMEAMRGILAVVNLEGMTL